ncbi:MAG: nucleotidyl transferase AbiEii/AbiGii toxin family protein [Nitrospirae bacterium]|nr:nucleotidyl transferase AbiEii/AbiGii toxin family protein [Nitrospirota bacterium]
MPDTQSRYAPDETAASISVLVELATALGAYREDIILVGGWVPYFLVHGNQKTFQPDSVRAAALQSAFHIGSLDIDLALNIRTIREPRYQAISRILEQRGYRSRGTDSPFSFVRKTQTPKGIPTEIQVDFLAPEYGGTGKRRRHQRVQDLLAHKAHGCDLAFEHFLDREIEATLPEGGVAKARIRMADVLPCLAMKAFALRDRLKEKDAYDIYMVCKHYPGSPESVVRAVKPHVANGLVREALSILTDRFNRPEAMGPVAVATFLEVRDPTLREIRIRDVYETVQDVVQRVSNIGLG